MNATAEADVMGAGCRIYVACLASYNNGHLHGRWIDVDGKDADELQEEVAEMLRGSPYPNVMVDCPKCENIEPEGCEGCGGKGKVPSAEEFAIHDHEGFGRMVEEYTSLADVAAIAEGLTGGDALAFRWLVEDRGYSVEDAAEKAADVSVYQAEGVHDLAADYAQEMVEECYSDALKSLPDFIRYAIDWERVARDLKIGGDIEEGEIDGERFIITNASEF